jgi:hypothetical protein
MKNQLQKITLVALFTLLFSCAKDDEVPPTVYGKWQVEKVNQINNGVIQPDLNPNPFNPPDCTKSFFDFKTDNSASFGAYNQLNCGLFSVNNRFITEGKIFQFFDPFGASLGSIVSLTKTELIFDVTPLGIPLSDSNDYRLYRITCTKIQ